jgi:predicted O-methyltransferase YrrM
MDAVMKKVLRRPYRLLRRTLDHISHRLVRNPDEANGFDPTLLPPPAYTRERADQIYGEAFRRFFEYLSGTRVEGDILEFGTFWGYSARVLACMIREFRMESRLYLFDSFEGLPEIDSPVDRQSYEVAINKNWATGSMFAHAGIDQQVHAGIAKVLPESQICVVKGYFEDTLDANLPDGKAALIHIDCDLYASTRQVLDRILSRGMPADGCVIVFDDYNCNRANPRMGERLALVDAFASQQRFTYSPWFSYGWHGMAFFIHDSEANSGENEVIVGTRDCQAAGVERNGK